MASFSSHCFLIPPTTVTSIIPIMKLAKLLASRGAKVTIYIPAEAQNNESSSSSSWLKHVVRDGDEFKASVDIVEVQISKGFLQETMMQKPIERHMEQQLQHVPASGIIADRFLFSWTKEIADKFMIPLLSISTLFKWSGTPYRLKHYMPVAVAVAARRGLDSFQQIGSDEKENCSDYEEIYTYPVDCEQEQCLNLEDQMSSDIDDDEIEWTEYFNLEGICSSVLRFIMDNGAAAAHTTLLPMQEELLPLLPMQEELLPLLPMQEEQNSSGGEHMASSSSSSSSSHSQYVVITMEPLMSPTSRMGLLLVRIGGAKVTMFTLELNEWLKSIITKKYKGLSQPPQIVQVSNIGSMKDVVERHMEQQAAYIIGIIADRDLYWAPEIAKKFVIPLFIVTRASRSLGQLGHYLGHYQPDSSILSHEATNADADANARGNPNSNGGFLTQYRWSLTLEEICETVIRTRGLSFQEIEIFMNNAAENQELLVPEPETEAAIVAENQELPVAAAADNIIVAENQELRETVNHIEDTLIHMGEAFVDLAVEVVRHEEMVNNIEHELSGVVYLLESWITALNKRIMCVKIMLPLITVAGGIWSANRYALWNKISGHEDNI